MKKNIIRLFVMAVFASIIAGCAPEELGVEGSFPYLELESNSKRLSKVGQSTVIEVKTNRQISLKFVPFASWISAQAVDNKITLTYEDNTLETERRVSLVITTANSTVSKEIVITQDASGELTFSDGDLILRSKDEIATNTYTKTVGNLVIGDVVIPTRSVDESVSVKLMDKYYTVAPSEITDMDIKPLTDVIKEVQGGGLVVANTNATTLPLALIKSNAIGNVNFDYNLMRVLPSIEEMASLNLRELSIKGNLLKDISNLEGCKSLEYLDISENGIYNVDVLKSMPSLKTVVMNKLPLTTQQVEVLRESVFFDVVAENLDASNSPLPIFGDVEITEVSDTEVEIKVQVIKNAKNLTKYGFYIGGSRNIAAMDYYDGQYSGGVISFTFRPETLLGKMFYVRAYAENTSGGNYSRTATFGNVISEEDIYIKSDADFTSFAEFPYSHIYGSFFVGQTSTYNSNGVLLDDGNYTLYFAPVTFTDMTPLRQLVYVRDGLYIGNAGLTNLNNVSQISGIQTLWLKANQISYIPELESDQTIKHLDVSMNLLTDFNFLERMPSLEKLYLGSSLTRASETNDIGILDGLEDYRNLKYLDLSGLPLHEWQVQDLRELMPETEVVFVSSGRTPHIPDVKLGRVTRTESSVTLHAYVASEGKTDVFEYGFYFGKDLNALDKIVVGTSISDGDSFSHTIDLPDMDMYYFYPYAINNQGESRCEVEEISLSFMNLSAGETANCYHISSPGRYKFDARVRGNSTESVGEPAIAAVLWSFSEPTYTSEVISSVELDNGFVKFEVSEGVTYGNALIAVKDAYGNILWSWHIWLSDFDPEESAQRYHSGAVLMDRNLGAAVAEFSDDYTKKLASGTQYQWGRKDPMVFMTITETPGTFSSVEESYSRPTAYVDSWTWIDDGNGIYDLWSSDRKTMYDPCPPGWKVADSDSWNNTRVYDSSSYGVHFLYDGSNLAQYPFSPHIDQGFISTEDTWYGRIWTSEAYDHWSPYSMTFYNYNTFSNELCNNSTALSVRCMKDPGFNVNITKVNPHRNTADVEAEIVRRNSASVTERGFVWSTSETRPGLNGSNQSVSLGGGSGVFSTTLMDLEYDTTYYIRAYAVMDGITKYSAVTTFKTGMGGSGDSFTEDDYYWE